MEKMNEKQLTLDKRYIRMAGIWAENSYCTRRQVGALIVKNQRIISDGYNGTPSGFAFSKAPTNILKKTTKRKSRWIPYPAHSDIRAPIFQGSSRRFAA